MCVCVCVCRYKHSIVPCVFVRVRVRAGACVLERVCVHLRTHVFTCIQLQTWCHTTNVCNCNNIFSILKTPHLARLREQRAHLGIRRLEQRLQAVQRPHAHLSQFQRCAFRLEGLGSMPYMPRNATYVHICLCAYLHIYICIGSTQHRRLRRLYCCICTCACLMSPVNACLHVWLLCMPAITAAYAPVPATLCLLLQLPLLHQHLYLHPLSHLHVQAAAKNLGTRDREEGGRLGREIERDREG